MGDSLRSTPVTNVAYLTMNGNFGNNNNDAQLTFRPLNKDLAPVTGNYYSLATNQTTDPSLRINQWSSLGQLVDYGYLYDSRFNLPPSTRTVVAGGYGGTTNVIYSLDNGSTWFPSVSGSALLDQCSSIAFNGSIWVAGGFNVMIYSNDGITWNTSSSGSGKGIIYGLASNGPLWVAGCSTGLLYSYDGINWISSATGSALLSSCFAIAWNGSLWVGVGGGSVQLIYSYDGIIWHSSTINGYGFSQGLSVAWNGTLWLAGGQEPGNTLAYSYDGIIWTAQSCVLIQVQAIAWSAFLWVIGGGSTTDSLLYGTDGHTWTPVPNSKTLIAQCPAIIWTGTVWLAAGQGINAIISSPDGINWTPMNTGTLLPNNACFSLAVNNVLPNAPLAGLSPPLLLGGDSGIIYSSDGITWEPIRPSVDLSGTTCRALLWNGSLWLGGFLGNPNTLGYSYDGLNWNISSNGSLALLDGCFGFATNGQISLAGGRGIHRIIYSSNGRDWLPIASADSLFDTGCLTIGYNGSVWVAGSDSNTNRLIYSSDPSGTWLQSASGNALFPYTCWSVGFNGRIWVAVGDTIAFSYDGINWTQAATIPPVGVWRAVAYNGSLWIAGGTGATPIAYSYDGSNWYATMVTHSITFCTSVTWTGSMWIACGGTTASAVYSYNGMTWFPSPDSKSLINTGYAVAAKRLNPNVGGHLPPPVLYPGSVEQLGQVVYSTGLNSLNVSSIMSINEASGTVQIQGDISANSIHVSVFNPINIITGDISANRISATDISATNLNAQNLYVSGITAPTITADTVTVNMDLSANAITANSVYSGGVIASLLPITSRGSDVIFLDISSTLTAWNYEWPIPSSAQPYSIFLVTVNATVINGSGGDAAFVLGIQEPYRNLNKYFYSSSTSTYLPISTTFIINATLSGHILRIIGATNSDPLNTFYNGIDSTKLATSIEIVGLA